MMQREVMEVSGRTQNRVPGGEENSHGSGRKLIYSNCPAGQPAAGPGEGGAA